MGKIVLVLIAINVFFSLKGFKDRFFFEKYKFQIGSILNGEKIRMLSSGFLHVDYLHLGFNMYALYLFSSPVINTIGGNAFLVVYFGSLLLGNMFTLYFHKKEPYYSAVGASGAVAGVVYSAILLYPTMTLYMFPIPIPIPGYVFGIGYLLYSVYGMKKQLGNVGHSAHLGGAIGGFILTLLLFPSVIVNNIFITAGLAVSILVVAVVGKKFLK